MTERELRLRRRIDELNSARRRLLVANMRLRNRLEHAPKRAAPWVEKPFQHCRWCGGWAWGPACTLHTDLEKMENELLRMAR